MRGDDMGFFSSVATMTMSKAIGDIDDIESQCKAEIKKIQKAIGAVESSINATKRDIERFELHPIRINTNAIGKIRSDEDFWSDVQRHAKASKSPNHGNVNGADQ